MACITNLFSSLLGIETENIRREREREQQAFEEIGRIDMLRVEAEIREQKRKNEEEARQADEQHRAEVERIQMKHFEEMRQERLKFENEMEEKKRIGQADINRIKTPKPSYEVIIIEQPTSTEETECYICQASLVKSRDDCGFTDCGHWFHTSCIKPWLKKKDECPVDRHKVTRLCCTDSARMNFGYY